MVRLALFWMVFLSAGQLGAQFDLGASVGLLHRSLHGRPSSGHTSAGFRPITAPDVCLVMFYRERHGARTNLGMELTWIRNEFDAGYYHGGIAGGVRTTVHVVLHTLNLSLLPEVKLSQRYSAVLRFGLAAGVRMEGNMNGTRYNSMPYTWSTEPISDAEPDIYGGELRAILGLGFFVPFGDGDGLTVDPYVARGYLQLKRRPGSVSNEVGLRLGWALRMKGKGFTRWLDERMATPPDGPNWP